MDSSTAQQIRDYAGERASAKGIGSTSIRWETDCYTLTLLGHDGKAHSCRFSAEDLGQYKKHPEVIEEAIEKWLKGVR